MCVLIRQALISPSICSVPRFSRGWAADLRNGRWTCSSGCSMSSGPGCRARRARRRGPDAGDGRGHDQGTRWPRHFSTSNRSGRGEPASRPGSSLSPQVPLCERGAEWTSSRADVRAFYDEARRVIRDELKDTLSCDGGPRRSDLELELEYIMEDAVVGWRDWRDAIDLRDEDRTHCQNDSKDLVREKIGETARNRSSAIDGPRTTVPCALRMGLEELRALWELRVEERVPLQYLTNASFWRDMIISVGPGVLIPRPETELMVDFVAEAVQANAMLGRGAWADLGTGSGALAVGLARQLPNVSEVYAADIAPAPLAYVAFNAERYGVAHRVRPIKSNWYEGLRRAGLSSGSLSGIVSNPPYIPSPTCETLQAEVKDHEPALALDGGSKLAVDCLFPICEGAADILVKGGFLALETNGGEQAHWIVELLRGYGFREVTIRRDLSGVDRFVTAIR